MSRRGSGVRVWLQACAMLLLSIVTLADVAWTQEVEFSDSNLRAGILAVLDKEPGETITQAEMETLTSLDLASSGIADLTGLESATNLVSLSLNDNAIQNLTPLSSLKSLTQLDLGGNRIVDISPLAGLEGLERLDIDANLIADLQPLSSLTALTELRVGGNPVRDFSPLAPLVRAGLTVHWQSEEPGEPRVVRAYFDDPVIARKIVISLEALESAYEKGYVVVLVSDADLEVLLRAGLRVVADETFPYPARPSAVPRQTPRQTPKQDSAGTIPGYSCYRTVEETYASAQAIADAFPELAEWIDVGDSWKKTQNSAEGYDLMVLKLTNSVVPGPKPKLFITSALHAREYATAELTTRFAEQMVDDYGIDADATWLLDEHEVHLMLHANPDGRKRAEEGLSWRKNHNEDHCPNGDTGEWLGVDLNRNFDFKWGLTGSSDQACAQTFRGSATASEPETQAITAYMQGLFPDARGAEDDAAAPSDTSGVFLDIHSHGRLVLWPWGHTDTTAPNGTQLQTLGRKLAFFSRHTPQQAIGLYPTSGTTEDYGYGELGVASYTFELGTSFFQDCNHFETKIVSKNISSLRYALKVARTPYITPAGPDAVGVSLSAGSVAPGVLPGTQVTLSTRLNDRRYSKANGTEPRQNIAAGEYYVDVPPWGESPSAVSLAAVDGAFDETVEDVTASIDTTGWSEGRYLIFVRAKDAADNWGAFSSVFLFINSAPEFEPGQGPWFVAENEPAGTAVGAPVVATDAEDDSLTYVLSGPDARLFRIEEDGQIRTAARLDYETQSTYMLEVTATDPGDAVATLTLTINVRNRDELGSVTPSSQQPQVGRTLVATLRDPDKLSGYVTWQWERSSDRNFQTDVISIAITDTDIGPTPIDRITASYTPVSDDLSAYLRTRVSYTDGEGAGKEAEWVSTAAVRPIPPPPPPPPPRPGGGGGGNVSRDLHGNTPTRATSVRLGRTAPWASSTAGQINTADDIDYFQFSLPQAGVLVVETTGQTDTVGTAWQDGVELVRMDSGGERRNFRLSTRVEAGPVVVAVEGTRGRTGAYSLETRLLAGFLENPGVESFQSGIGVLSGWVCEAEEVEIEIETERGAVERQGAAYGTERLDTERVCGDTDNGFGVLFNWNLLGDGTHTVVALVYGVELGRATVTVTTLGEEFLKDVAGECEVPDFPTVGEMVTLVWQQTSQNFVIASGNPPDGDNAARSGDLEGYLENPGPNSFQSGIGIISGWVCDAETVEIVIGDLAPQVASYGTERLDTEAACGDTDNGFGLLFNWNLLGDGTHPIVALVDEIELGRATVQVTTLGHEFLRGAEGACVVDDFPILGKKVTLEWQQNSQNFVITEVE